MRNNQFKAERRTHSEVMRRRRRQQKRVTKLCICLFAIAIVSVITLLYLNFRSTHFSKGTTINDVDVSLLTIEQSYDKINDELCNRIIDFYFKDTEYYYFGDYFELQIDSIDELNQFKSEQIRNHKLKSFYLSSLYLNEGKIQEELYGFKFLNEENMTYPQNAYTILSEDNNLLEIVPEKNGTYIDFNEAYEFALENLKCGCSQIDFESIAYSQPEVTAEILQESVDTINSMLNTTITFKINEDSSLTLNKSVMKDWLYSDCNGSYDIDIDSNLPKFIQQLAEITAKSAVVNFEFKATGIGTVTVPATGISLDEDAMEESIRAKLGSSESSFTCTPIYDNISIGDTYVEIDTSRQHVWMYKDGNCIVDTDCVTGMALKHDTPPGYFFLTGKVPGKVLRGYNDNGSKYAAPVSYWMPFNGGIGLHDASWRTTFGGTIYLYDGSHGCVNLPKSVAKTIYENIDMDTPIIVYSSIIK